MRESSAPSPDQSSSLSSVPSSSKAKSLHFPISEMIKSVPGVFGVRLEEEPQYELIRFDGDVELRKYESLILAQIECMGTQDEATEEGFNYLASYIFGENESRTKMDMTIPVFQESPVQTLGNYISIAGRPNEMWIISFFIPPDYDLTTVPEPLDPRVKIIRTESRTVAAVRFSGTNTEENRKHAKERLEKWLKENKLEARSPLAWAQYDQPLSIPLLRRNEVLVEI